MVSKQSIPLVFPSKPPNLSVCFCMHLSALHTSQIYLSSVIVTTVSSGTLACSTVALSLCGVKCVCVCSLSQAIALFTPWNSEYICGSHAFVALNYSDSKSQFTQTHSFLLNIQDQECVCVCIPVLRKAFSPLHSLMITHTHAVGGMFRLGMSSSQQPNYSD